MENKKGETMKINDEKRDKNKRIEKENNIKDKIIKQWIEKQKEKSKNVCM